MAGTSWEGGRRAQAEKAELKASLTGQSVPDMKSVKQLGIPIYFSKGGNTDITAGCNQVD